MIRAVYTVQIYFSNI